MVEKVAAKLSQTKGIISPFQILYGVRKKNMALPGSVGSWYSANSCGLECWWCWNFNIAILQIKWYGVGNSPTSPRRHATNLFHLFWFLSSGPLFFSKISNWNCSKIMQKPGDFWTPKPLREPQWTPSTGRGGSPPCLTRHTLTEVAQFAQVLLVSCLHGTVLTRKLPLFDCCCVALILETKIKLLKNLLQSLGDLEFAKPSCPFFPSSMITNPPSQLCVGWFLEPIGISQSSISRQIEIWRVHLLSPKNLSELKKFTNSEFEVSY